MSPRIVHLSDLHLGFRAYPGMERGLNRRERDVTAAFHRALQDAARLRPDLVLISGDLFHRPDPPSTAFLALVRGLRTFQSLLPSVPILAIAGERDTPRVAADPGPLAVLDALDGVEAAAGAARAVRIRSLGVHALLVPHRAVREPPLPELQPDRDARHNVLLVRGALDGHAPALDLDPADWDYVAVGGPHRTREFAPRVRAAGSLERIGWDPWAEGTEEKGFVLFDLERGEGEFHPVAARPVVDLAPVRCDPTDPAAGSRRLRHLLESLPGGIDGRIVRVRLEGDLRLPEEGVDAGLLEGVRRRAAHLEVRLGRSARSPRSGNPRPAQVEGPLVSTDPAERAGSGEPADARPALPDRGLHLLLADTDEALQRAVEALAALPPRSSAEEAVSTELLRLLRVGGAPVRLAAAAAALISGDEAQRGGGGERAAEPRDSVGGSDGVRGREGAGSPAGPGETGRHASASPTGAELGAQLRKRRGDAIEAEGEVEAGTFEWARERQDAETRLQAHRDRAQELRERLRALEDEAASCPTCGRALGDDRERLRAVLREQWETVVQDGKWWKRRREQLDERPAALVELEARARALRRDASELAEAIEEGRRGEKQAPSGPDRIAQASDGAVLPTDGPRTARELERFLARAGSHLRLWSEGRLSGLGWSGEGAPTVVDRGHERAPTFDEARGVALALHLALREEWAARGEAPGAPGDPAGAPPFLLLQGIDERGADPLLPLLEGLLQEGIPVLVALPPAAPLPGTPGVGGIRMLEGDGAGLRLVRVPAGPAVLRWTARRVPADPPGR